MGLDESRVWVKVGLSHLGLVAGVVSSLCFDVLGFRVLGGFRL